MNGRIRPGGGPCGGRSLGGTAALRPPTAPGVNRGELPRRGADDNRGLACEIPTPRMSNPVQPGDRYRPTVLVVDDNPDQRELVRRMVERAGYACVVAADGREARGLLQAGTIEVAVTDVFMPDEDGLEFLHHVREQRPDRSEEHTSELQSLMRTSYAVFFLKTNKQQHK